jgi:probable HAF family extracellular repeat protein
VELGSPTSIINNNGEVVGYYTSANGAFNAFKYSLTTDTLTLIDLPGTKDFATDINDLGQVIGYYNDFHGFIALTGPQIQIAANGTDLWEGDSGATPFTFTVSRTGDTSASVTVNWAVTGGQRNPADAQDFVGGLPHGTLTLAAGQASQTLTVNVLGDSSIESGGAIESFVVTLSNASVPASINPSQASASGSIWNDDAPKSTDDIFRETPKLAFLAELANAAYHLDHTSLPGLAAHELGWANSNDASTSGDFWYKTLGGSLWWFTAGDFPSLAPTASGNPNFPVTGLHSGIYTNANGRR